MAKAQSKARKVVVSIETGRQSRTGDVERFISELLADRLYADFEEDWSSTLAQLKVEISQIDRAILALTRLVMGRGQRSLCLSPTGAAEQTEGQECSPKQKTR